MKLLIIILAYTCLVTLCLAQTPITKKVPASRLELLTLEKGLAKSDYELRQTNFNLSRLVAASEKLVAYYCFPRVYVDFAYNGLPEDAHCKAEISELETINPLNPVVTCARNGFTSASCKQAFVLQKTEAFIGRGNSKDASPFATWELAFESARLSSAEKVADLWQKITSARGEIFAEKDPAKLAALNAKTRSLQSQLLKLTCGVSRLSLEEASAKRFGIPMTFEPTKPPLAKQDQQLLELLKELPGAKVSPSPSPTPTGLVRIRYVGDLCRRTLESMRKLDPEFSGIPCYLHGSYSPECFDAVLKNKKKLEAAPTDHGTPTAAQSPIADKAGGFETF